MRKFPARPFIVFSAYAKLAPIMKNLLIVCFAAIFAVSVSAQSDLQRLAEAEISFADFASKNGMKPAFLEFLSDTAFVFAPDQRLGKEFWRSQPESKNVYIWRPELVDIAGNGTIGYTTGPWELRPDGAASGPTEFGQFATVWQRQKDGSYKVVLDIGVSAPKMEIPMSGWHSPGYAGKSLSEDPFYVADVASEFFELMGSGKIETAYKEFAASDIRLLRQGEAPIIGKAAALDTIRRIKGKFEINKRMAFMGTNDLAYAHNKYRITGGKKNESGNFLQVWRFLDKRWQIVLDVFKPLS